MKYWCIVVFIIYLAKANGQIIYHDLHPDVVFPKGTPPPAYSYNLDIDGNGTNDYQIFQAAYPFPGSATIRYDVSPLNGNKIIVAPSGGADTLKFGDSINASSIFTTTSAMILINNYGVTPSTSNGTWKNVENHFIGICFNSPTGLKYGWIRLLNTVTIADYAYNSAITQPILAGEGLPYTVDQVRLTDVSNSGNGTDLSVKFFRTLAETEISGYRIMVVPSLNASVFTVDSAKRVLNANSFFIPPMNKNIDTTLNNGSKDVYGNPIISLKPYKAFVISLPNLTTSFDTLMSVVSNEIILTSPTFPVQQLAVTSTKIPASLYNLNITFNIPSNESAIDSYRLFFIHEKDSVSFTIDSAKQVLPGNYLSISKTGVAQNLNYLSLVRTNKGNFLKPFEKYKAVVMSVCDTINSNESSLSLSSNSFTVYTQVQAVDEIIMSDVADNHEITDINVFFRRVSNESNVSVYRGLIVPHASVATFNLDSANASSTYMFFAPNGQNQNMQLLPGFYDIHGNPVVESQLYHFFVLTVNDNNLSDVNALSSVSKHFLYTTPNCFYANDTLTGDYHNIKDTTIYGIHNDPPQHYELDLDTNHVMDLRITCYDVGGLGAWMQRVEVTPLNNTQFNFSATLPNFIMVSDSADMIHSGMNWSSSQGIIKQRVFGQDVNGTFIMTLKGTVNFDVVKFMAVRLIGVDTVYAWLKLSALSCPSINRAIGATVYSYGVQKHSIDNDVGIKTDQLNEPVVKIYPNPSTDHTKIVLSGIEQVSLEVISVDGKIILSKTISGTEYNLNTSGLSQGIYGLRVISKDKKSRVYKLIVQ